MHIPLWFGTTLLATSPGSAFASTAAVIVGVGTYPAVPDSPTGCAADARLVATTLERSGATVTVLTDDDATKQAVVDALQALGGPEPALVYLCVHGVGAGMGMPTLLLHDSTLENGQEDGLPLEALAADLPAWLGSQRRVVLVVDAMHGLTVSGVELLGPAAQDWPDLPDTWTVLSPAGPGQASTPRSLATAMALGIDGAADGDDDGTVGSAELTRYVASVLPDAGTSGSNADDALFEARRSRGQMTLPADGTTFPPPVSAAKFTWQRTQRPVVDCNTGDPVTCDPSCYVRRMEAGLCTVEAGLDGVVSSTVIPVLEPGRYDCQPVDGEIRCTGP